MSLRHTALLAVVLSACTGREEPAPQRDSSAPPDLVLVAFEGAPLFEPRELTAATVLPGALSVHPSPGTAWAALLTGQWPGTTSASPPNTLHGVLQLYGYQPQLHASPALEAAGERSAWLLQGLERLPGPCPADSLAAALRAPVTDPGGARLTVIAVPADDGACPGSRAAVLAQLSGLAAAGSHPRHVALVGLSAATADLRSADLRAQLAFSGPGWDARRVPGPATVVDVLPTLLTLGGAVVPSDASGVDLSLTRTIGPGALPPAVFLQDAAGNALVRTSRHQLWIPTGHREAMGSADPLPQAILDDLQVHTLDGSPEPDAGAAEAVVQTARAWERSLAGRTAADRAGADTLRQILAEQGYWD